MMMIKEIQQKVESLNYDRSPTIGSLEYGKVEVQTGFSKYRIVVDTNEKDTVNSILLKLADEADRLAELTEVKEEADEYLVTARILEAAVTGNGLIPYRM